MMTVKDDDKSSNLMNNVPEDGLKELRAFSSDCLQKAGLIELREKLRVCLNLDYLDIKH